MAQNLLVFAAILCLSVFPISILKEYPLEYSLTSIQQEKVKSSAFRPFSYSKFGLNEGWGRLQAELLTLPDPETKKSCVFDPPPFTFTISQTGSYTTASGSITCGYPGYVVEQIKVSMNGALVGTILPNQSSSNPLVYSNQQLPISVELQFKLKPTAPSGLTIDCTDQTNPGPQPNEAITTVTVKKKIPGFSPIINQLVCNSTMN